MKRLILVKLHWLLSGVAIMPFIQQQSQARVHKCPMTGQVEIKTVSNVTMLQKISFVFFVFLRKIIL